MRVPHPIPYQGSKRSLARAILAYLPSDGRRLIEPFAGSAAVSLAAIATGMASRCLINDSNGPLMHLWAEIIERPILIADAYEQHWHDQRGRERSYYADVRERFNQMQQPADLLYLLARCVKAAVRYNARGEFNQSADHRRRGMRPATMRRQVMGASGLLRGKTDIAALEYRDVLEATTSRDLVYLDPPYQGVGSGRDRRYIRGLDLASFVDALRMLNARDVPYIVSYDGRTGAKRFGQQLPAFLELTRIEINAGRSSQATLLGRDAQTYESLYLSPALVALIKPEPMILSHD